MKRLFQLAALALVLLMGAPPVLAAVPCSDAAMAPGCCGAGCAMAQGMAKVSVASQSMGQARNAMPASQAHCQKGPTRQQEFVETKAPNAPAALLPEASSRWGEALLAAAPVHRQVRSPMRELAPSAAHLCTFLI